MNQGLNTFEQLTAAVVVATGGIGYGILIQTVTDIGKRLGRMERFIERLGNSWLLKDGDEPAPLSDLDALRVSKAMGRNRARAKARAVDEVG